MNRIIIFGGSGFIGRRLVGLLKDDYMITVISRNPEIVKNKFPARIKVDTFPDKTTTLALLFDEADGVINLAGENIGGGRWTPDFKDKILNSRLQINNLIKDAFEKSEKKPSFYIHGSASGYYGIDPSDKEITETSPSLQDSFLTSVAYQSEESIASLAEQTRLLMIRTGIVLDRTEGALPRIALPFKLFAGGPVGDGKQWFPWIHIDDIVNAIRFAIENESLSGPVNLTAPNPVRQKQFATALGKVLKRPSFMPAPAFALRIMLGKEKANELLLSGLRVIPGKLNKAGFRFQFEQLNEALVDIYR